MQNNRFDLETRTYDLPLVNLPDSLIGKTVVQLSDFHRGCGQTDPLIEEAVAQTNALEPDYILLTGDFVDRHKRDITPAVNLVRKLRAKQGIFGVLGNHDYYSDAGLIRNGLEAVGIEMLQNRAVEAAPGFWLAGIDDLLEGAPKLDAALKPIPHETAAILLAHNPNTLDRIAPTHPLVILSGHTHGGQIVLPFPPPSWVCRYHLNTRFVHGWYQRGRARMYVNRGIGVTGWGPYARRIHCPSEITVLHLARAEETEKSP